MAITPLPGATAVVATGGTAVVAVPATAAGINCIVTNPSTVEDQGTGLGAPERIIVNPVDAAGLMAFGNNFAIEPGASWTGIAGQNSAISVNAATDGHRFSVVYWTVEPTP